MGFHTRRSVKGRGIPPAFLIKGAELPVRELSVFIDESGNLGNDSKYYIVGLVFHDQDESFTDEAFGYERLLSERGLPNYPFHSAPLIHGNEAYRDLEIADRTRLLSSFAAFAWRIPFRYHVFSYEKSWFEDKDAMSVRMRRDIISYLFEFLGFFQKYSCIKIYYDDGQKMITNVIHAAFEYALGSQAIVYRFANPGDYRLAQVSDFACGIELAAMKYEHHEEGKSDALFFGKARDFKKNYLKKLRKKWL